MVEGTVIRPLRQAHRWIVITLAILLPLVLGIALVLRPEAPRQQPWVFEQRP